MLIGTEQHSPLHVALEERFEWLTAELTRLTMNATTPERIGYDQHGLDTQVASTRRKLIETTQALRRMASGTYGRCERCRAAIPAERLEIRPHARYCVPCQQALGS